jgi:translation initiation factor 2B subunit (eIF-2B alpha/beta/delta family)
MERLRHVARSGGIDPEVIVVETVDALTRLAPASSELVPLCRNLVERNPTCGPLWWLCAHLLAKPEALSDSWRLADQVVADATATRLVEALPVGSRVLTVGSPRLVLDALCDRPDLFVSTVDPGDSARHLIRRLDRSGVTAGTVRPEATLVAARCSDVVLVEAEACSTDAVVGSMGSGLAAAAGTAVGVPVWLVAGRGRRLPVPFIDAISVGLDAEHEAFSTDLVSIVAGADGVMPRSRQVLAAECPAIPELVTGS